MKRWILLILVSMCLAACSGAPLPDTSQEDLPVASPTNAPPEDVMENIEMSLWPANAAPRQGQKPVLSIRARRFMGSVGSGGEWTFEDAEAVAPAQDEKHASIRFKAARGVFLEDQRAVLQGGVTAYINDMTIHLEDITWEIGAGNGETPKSGTAYSNNPIRIDSPTQKLDASSMTLNPETAIIELPDVSGEFYFGGHDQ